MKPFFPARIVAIIALSTVLGWTFNASSPLGIRFGSHEEAKRAGLGLQGTNSSASFTVTNGLRPQAPVGAQALGKTSATQNSARPTATPSPSTASTPVASIIPPPFPNVPAFNAPSPTSWAQVKPILLAGKMVLVDARTKGMFDAGHIPGAVSLPEISSTEDLVAFEKKYGANSHVVIYCSSTSCSLSLKLATKLAKDYGFSNVQYMTGGYLEWQRENALSTSAVSSPSSVLPPARSTSNPGPSLNPTK